MLKSQREKEGAEVTGSRGKNGAHQAVGSEALDRLSEEFHRRIEQDPELRSMFPKDMGPLSGRFALFLIERVGGPLDYTATRGKQSLICRHAHLSISLEEADRWLTHMDAAMDAVGMSLSDQAHLRDIFVKSAQTLTDPYIPLYRLPLEDLRQKVTVDPKLLETSYSGQSLLREAVSRWDASRVRILLESGADPNQPEPLGHGALYRAVNTVIPGEEEMGREVVRLLITHGASPNFQSGPGKSTPLHVAARRGSVFLAEILLESGAEIERLDSKGESPLRRAVNCGQLNMVSFLLSWGANPMSRDKRGVTPLAACRSAAISDCLLASIRSGGNRV